MTTADPNSASPARTGGNALQFPGWVKANKILAELAEQGVDVEPIGSH